MKQYQLPKEFAEKWIEALSSGKYKQTQKILCDGSGFCCLGVAGLIAGFSSSEMFMIPDLFAFEKDARQLPLSIFLNAERDLQAYVAGLNDDEHYTFKQIANWLTTNVEFI